MMSSIVLSRPMQQSEILREYAPSDESQARMLTKGIDEQQVDRGVKG